MITMLPIFLFLLFTVLGFFHFYWFFGGLWGIENVIPTIDSKTDTIKIPKLATLIVAIVLVIFGSLYLIKSGIITSPIPYLNYAYWFIPTIFILRAIGEFKYVGFFKKIKHTKFAKADSKIFSPLCLIIGLIGILIQFLK